MYFNKKVKYTWNGTKSVVDDNTACSSECKKVRNPSIDSYINDGI